MENAPEQDELVFATVKKLLPYGAFCSLDEYNGREAFVHISEVAPRWIKNIHEFLREGQRVVAKVYRVVEEKNQIDLSLKRVSESEKKRKLECVKREKRGEKLFELALKDAKSTASEATAIREKLEQKFGTVYDAFEVFATDGGEDEAKDLRLEKGFLKAALDVAKKSIKKARMKVAGMITLVSFGADGVDDVKSVLAGITELEGKEVKMHYMGAPHYKVEVVADDFKSAEKTLEDIITKIKSGTQGRQMSFSFERLKKEGS